MSLRELSNEEIEEMPIDRLAMQALQHIGGGNESIYNFLLNLPESSQQGEKNTPRPEAAKLAIAEAMNWLINNGLLSRNKPRGDADSILLHELVRQLSLTANLASVRWLLPGFSGIAYIRTFEMRGPLS